MKKSIIKIVAVMLSLIFALSMLCGCEEETTDTSTAKATAKPTPENIISQIKLSGYVYYDKCTNLEDYAMSFNNQYPGIEITVYRDDVGTDVYFDNIDAIIEAEAYDELGDVVLLDSSRMAKLAAKGVLVNLSNYVGDVLNFDTYEAINPKNDLLPAAYEACLYNEQLYMVAIEYNHNFVFLNVSLLEKYGEEFPADDWTWDDLVSIAKNLKEQGVETPVAMDYTDYSVWGAFARSNGQDIYDNIGDSDEEELCLTNPDVVSGLEYLAEIVSEEAGIVDCVNASELEAEDLSKYAFVIADHEDITRWEDTICAEGFETSEEGFSWDYIHFPRWDGEDGTYYQSIGANVYGFAVINHGEDNEDYDDEFYTACAYLALQATVTSTAEDYCMDGEAVPACAEANSYKFWREYPVEGKNSSVFSNFAETADYCSSLSCFMPVMSENEIDITYAIDGYLKGERTMVESLQTLQDKAIASWVE